MYIIIVSWRTDIYQLRTKLRCVWTIRLWYRSGPLTHPLSCSPSTDHDGRIVFKGELQRQNKLILSERPSKILQNETKIIKISQAVLEIFTFKDWDLDNFTIKDDRKTENVVFWKFCTNWRTIDCVTSEMINAQFNNKQSRTFLSVVLIRT